jgi:hypothetical protein
MLLHPIIHAPKFNSTFKKEFFMIQSKSALSMSELAEQQKNKPKGFVRQSPRPLQKKQAQHVQLPKIASTANSERQEISFETKKVQNMRVLQRKGMQNPTSTREARSERQDSLLKNEGAHVNLTDSSNTRVNTVNTELEARPDIASNKTVVHKTVTTVDTPINEVAANDTNYEGTPVTNIITQPPHGVSLPNENSNLTSSQLIKATLNVDRLTTTQYIPPRQHNEVLKAAADMCTADKNGLHLKEQQNKHGSEGVNSFV